MENLNQAFTHVNKAFSSTNHLFDRRIGVFIASKYQSLSTDLTSAANPDVSPTEIIHVSNLDDVQSLLLAPMEVIETDPAPQRRAIAYSNLYVKPMTEELSRRINDAITNSWRVDLNRDAAPTAPEESDLTLGLTRQESTWLKMLMKGPILRSRTRAIEDAWYVQSLDDSSAHSREYDRRLLEPLTPKQFHQEVDAFYGSESCTDEQNAEMEGHERDDADEICLVDTSGDSPQKRMQMRAVDHNGSTSPFCSDHERHLGANAWREEDDMNSEGLFDLSQVSRVENGKDCYGHEGTKQTTPAEAFSPQAPHNKFDVSDEEPEYEPPETFDCLSPPRQDYTLGPFMIDDIDTFQHTAPEAEMSAQQTDRSVFWHDGYEPATLSLQDSEQPMDLVPLEDNIIPNIDLGPDFQLEAELNASTNEYNTDSPGPYTLLLKSTDDYNTSVTHGMRCSDSTMQELALREPTFTSTNMTEPPILRSNRTPSPPTRTLPLTPAPPTTSNSIITTFTTPTPLPPLLPKSLPHAPSQPSTTIHHPPPLHAAISSPLTPTNPRPRTPKSKSVKAVFASPNLRSGPPSPIKPNKNNNLDRGIQSKISAHQTCGAESAHQATATATDDDDDDDDGEGDTVRVQVPVSGRAVRVGLGLGLGLLGQLQMQMQMQPDSAIDVSFPAAERVEEETVAVGKTSTKAKAATPKKKVGRPRKVRSAVGDGSGGGLGGADGGGETEKGRGVTKSPLRKRARKGVRGAVGGGGS